MCSLKSYFIHTYIHVCLLIFLQENCDYELQEEDVSWLNNKPEYSKSKDGQAPILEQSMLERMIDLLEKTTPVYTSDPPSVSETESIFAMKLDFDCKRSSKVVAEVRQFWIVRPHIMSYVYTLYICIYPSHLL
jgi:hypothetical protein